MRFDTVVRNARLVTAEGGESPRPVAIAIQDGLVAGVFLDAEGLEADEVIDARGNPVLPGAIDTHAHWNNPGPFPEGCSTESVSAALGGVTTILNFYRPATDRPYEELLPDEIAGGERSSLIDFAFQLGILQDEHVRHIDRYVGELGVTSFKLYMTRTAEAVRHSNSFGAYTDALLYDTMQALAQHPGTVVCVHCENAEIVTAVSARLRAEGRDGLTAWSDGRPAIAEGEATHRALYLGERTGCPVFVPHMSSRPALEELAAFKARGVAAYGETCPHYLSHTAESTSILGKINPPIRSEADREALWQAVADGTIDTIGSDNVAIQRAAKQGTVWEAAPGMANGGVIVPVLLSEGVNRGRISLRKLVEVSAYNAARLFGLYPRKGTLQVGSDADLIVVDRDLERTVTTDLLRSHADYTIYEGMRLTGWPVLTMVRGRVVQREGEIVAERGHGRFIARPAQAGPIGRAAVAALA